MRWWLPASNALRARCVRTYNERAPGAAEAGVVGYRPFG
jgi:hypothetical protein